MRGVLRAAAFLAARGDQEVEDVGRVIGGHAPAVQVEVAVGIHDGHAVLRNGTRGHLGLDADAAQEACNRGADGFVIHIAVIGRVQGDGEAIGVARFLEQGLGLVHDRPWGRRPWLVVAVDKRGAITPEGLDRPRITERLMASRSMPAPWLRAPWGRPAGSCP
jgi:hypothetical protein